MLLRSHCYHTDRSHLLPPKLPWLLPLLLLPFQMLLPVLLLLLQQLLLLLLSLLLLLRMLPLLPSSTAAAASYGYPSNVFFKADLGTFIFLQRHLICYLISGLWPGPNPSQKIGLDLNYGFCLNS